MKTITDYLQIIIVECYTYCDKPQPRQCCRMAKLSIDMIRRGEY